MMACNKCNSTGYIEYYAHVQGGICFRCRGTGHHPGDGVDTCHVECFQWHLDEPEPRLVILQHEFTLDLAKTYVDKFLRDYWAWAIVTYHRKQWVYGLTADGIARMPVTSTEQYKELVGDIACMF